MAFSIGTPAWRANLLSSIFDVASAALLFLSIDMLSSCNRAYYKSINTTTEGHASATHLAASTITLLYSFSPLVWQYAVTAEVFALNNALVSALVYLTLCVAVTPNEQHRLGYTFLGAFVCGLALCNQHTAVLFEIPLIFYVAWVQRHSLMRHPMLMAFILGMCFLGGLMPYAYLPLAALRHHRAGSWGDVTTLKGFFHHLRYVKQ